MGANDRQIGGEHYRRAPGEQHWDRLVRLYGLPAARCYFIGNITAYVERYQDKNGVQDLEKAAHYLQKLIELEQLEEAKVGNHPSHVWAVRDGSQQCKNCLCWLHSVVGMEPCKKEEADG
jgi:hypothetical protein